MSKIPIIFVCHNNDAIAMVIHHNHYIMFVGNEEINADYLKYSKLIIARNLKHNIEDEPKLLTFTAWYAIIMNDLFLNNEYLCILEYDVLISDKFEEVLNEPIITKDIKNISFSHHEKKWFFVDINLQILQNFLIYKNVDINIIKSVNYWNASTNQCVNRKVLCDFVNWYYPSYQFIKGYDYPKFSYYHERLFTLYLMVNNIEVIYKENILNHFQLGSHKKNCFEPLQIENQPEGSK